MKFGNLRSSTFPRVRAGSMKSFVTPARKAKPDPDPEVRMGEKVISHTRPAFGLSDLKYYCLSQYLDKNDSCIFEITLADGPEPVRIKLFHIDHHLNVYWYNNGNKEYFGKLGGHYDKAHNETGIYFTSTDFVFTEDELKNLSALFAKCRNFYDIEEEFIVTIMDSYGRFAKHKELINSITSQISKENTTTVAS